MSNLVNLLAVVPALGPDWLQPDAILTRFGGAALAAVCVILFVECGLFLFFLPGDSLLFVTGLFLSTGLIATPLWLAVLLMTVSAIAGNVVGYQIGVRIGPPLLHRPNSRLVKPQYVTQTHDFLEKHGARAVILARFVPVVRTFVTAVAGVAGMAAGRFYRYSAIGGVLWVGLLTMAGYLVGDRVPWVQRNIELIAILIVVLSVIPIGVEIWRARRTSTS